MNVFDLFLTSIYNHFIDMKERGRQVVPWFQTTFAKALFTSISVTAIVKVIFQKSYNPNEFVFLSIFISIGLAAFLLIKEYYFNDDKHIILSEIYLEYSSNRRLVIKTLSIMFLLATPLLLGFVIWLKAK